MKPEMRIQIVINKHSRDTIRSSFGGMTLLPTLGRKLICFYKIQLKSTKLLSFPEQCTSIFNNDFKNVINFLMDFQSKFAKFSGWQ